MQLFRMPFSALGFEEHTGGRGLSVAQGPIVVVPIIASSMVSIVFMTTMVMKKKMMMLTMLMLMLLQLMMMMMMMMMIIIIARGCGSIGYRGNCDRLCRVAAAHVLRVLY